MNGSSQTRAIFINYRRDDTGGEAGRLYDDLTRAFSTDTVFMDVAGIQPGKDFRQSIDENVTHSGVLLAIIGRHWLTVADSSGARRLDNPNDFVRLEIASALARDIPVIPVLVQGASMPAPGVLPEPLQDFAYRNAVELTLARWNSDVALLVAALKSHVHPAAAANPVYEASHIRLPPVIPPPPPRAKPSLNQIFGPIAAAIVIAVLILIALTAALYEYGKKLPSTSTPSPAATQGLPPGASLQPAQKTQAGLASPASSSSQPAPLAVTQPREPPPPVRSSQALSAASPDQPARQHPEATPAIKPLPDTRRWGEQEYRVEIPYNETGVYDDGESFLGKPGLDGSGRAFHSFQNIMIPGTYQLPLGGATFRFPPRNIPNVFRCRLPTTLDLSQGVYTTLKVLAVSTHGPQLAATFTVVYRDGSKQDFVQNISDWAAPATSRFPGEHLAVEQTYASTAAGSAENGRFALYEYDFVLKPDLDVRTLILPRNENVVVLAITFVP